MTRMSAASASGQKCHVISGLISIKVFTHYDNPAGARVPAGLVLLLMMNCPQCDAPVLGEMQSFCKSCLYTFTSGGDRWFDMEDEEIPIKDLE